MLVVGGVQQPPAGDGGPHGDVQLAGAGHGGPLSDLELLPSL